MPTRRPKPEAELIRIAAYKAACIQHGYACTGHRGGLLPKRGSAEYLALKKTQAEFAAKWPRSEDIPETYRSATNAPPRGVAKAPTASTHVPGRRRIGQFWDAEQSQYVAFRPFRLVRAGDPTTEDPGAFPRPNVEPSEHPRPRT